MRLRLLLASAAALTFAGTAHAQQNAVDADGGVTARPLATVAPPPVTTIIPDQTAPLSLGTQVTRTGNIYTVDGGTRAGANLFHSFSRFDLGQGDFARWVQTSGNAADIRFVINRVTGGDPSDIYGTIDSSALPNADFFFINPAGIVFGEGAHINVPAAAHFATAQEVRFDGGGSFTVATPGGSTLSIAAPASFGFVGGQGAISVDNVGFGFLPNVTDLTLAASNVTVSNSEILANGARFIGVGSGAAQIGLSGPAPSGLTGTVLLDSSAVRMTGDATRLPAGIRLEAGLIDLSFSDLGTNFTGLGISGLSGPISLVADGMNVFATLISASSFGDEPAGDIRLIGRDISIDASLVVTETRAGSTGTFGSIDINGSERLLIDGRSRVTASTATDQRGGDISLTGGAIVIDGGSVVQSSTLPGANGDAGLVTVTGNSLEISDASTITSSTEGNGDAGSVLVTIAGLTSINHGSIQSATLDNGNAGLVLIQTGALVMDDESLISTGTFFGGNAGIVAINAGSIIMDGRSIIQSRAQEGSSGEAGLVTIGGGSLFMTGGSGISSDTDGSGAGGGILIEMRDVELRDSAVISSSSGILCAPNCGPTGNAGGIFIKADTLRLINTTNGDPPLTIASAAAGSGNAGEIMLQLGRLEMEGGYITSQTNAGGNAGSIDITAGDVDMHNAILASNTFGSGNAGRIRVTADSLTMRVAAITTSTGLPCDVGCTSIGGDGGSIQIDIAGALNLLEDSRIESNGISGTGNAGQISVTANSLFLQEGRISSSTTRDSTGRSGRISIGASTLEIRDAGSIETISRNGNEAGAIEIGVDRLTLTGAESRISTSNEFLGGGDAGGIFISANALSLFQGGQLTSSSAAGAAGSIEIFMPSDSLLILASTVPQLSLINTSSGPGLGGRILISSPRAIISHGGSILALGQSGGANVLISSGYFIRSADRTNRVAVSGNLQFDAAISDVSSGTVERDLSVLDASGVLRGQCAAARATGEVSQLVVRPIGPYGARPVGAMEPRPGNNRLMTQAELQASCS